MDHTPGHKERRGERSGVTGVICYEHLVKENPSAWLFDTKFRGDKLSRSPRAKINFREYKLSRMGPFKNLASKNLRHRGKFLLNFLIFMQILTIFFLYFHQYF